MHYNVAIIGNNLVKPALCAKNWQRTLRYGVIFSNATTPALCVTVASIQTATVYGHRSSNVAPLPFEGECWSSQTQWSYSHIIT